MILKINNQSTKGFYVCFYYCSFYQSLFQLLYFHPFICYRFHSVIILSMESMESRTNMLQVPHNRQFNNHNSHSKNSHSRGHNNISRSHSKRSHHCKRKKTKKTRRGALANVTDEQLTKYYGFLNDRRSESLGPNVKWLPSIVNFKKVIDEDPVLRMNWEYGIFQCTKTLPGKTGDDVIDMIDTACKTPPSYSNSDLVGFPINSIFVQFMQNQNGRTFFSSQTVNQALKLILDDYNAMLNSKESLEFMNEESPTGWFCPQAQLNIDYSLYICDPNEKHYGFKCWNHWFLRQFKPGVRPLGVGSPHGVSDDNIILNSCESTPLLLPVQPQRNVKETDHFWLKDDVYSLSDMFAATKFGKQALVKDFVGGTVYQAFLSALFYHRWHSPVDGVIEDIYSIPGTYYLDQSQFIPYDEGSPNNSESFLSAVAARKVVVIKASNKHIGKIAIIYIGMAEVSSCVTTVNIGQRVKKGQQIGHFQFGGSSHVMVFQKKVKLQFQGQLYSQDVDGELIANRQDLSSYLATVVVE